MKDSRQTENAAAQPLTLAELRANFLALKEKFQALEAENAELNRKKTHRKETWRWSTKRLLLPPASRTKSVRQVGAPVGNTNRLKHGNYTRERLLFYATVRTCVQQSRALVAWVTADFGSESRKIRRG